MSGVNDDGPPDEGREPSGRVPGPLNQQWMLAAAGGFVLVVVAVVAGTASFWDSEPDLQDQASGPPPPREYGGPLWFTVGGADETQLVTNTLPRGVPGPGSEFVGTARYLEDAQCFVEEEKLLIWPRGSRPITGERPGVNPGDGVDILDGEQFRAIAEEIVIEDAEEFPEIDEDCAPSGIALSLSDVRAN